MCMNCTIVSELVKAALNIRQQQRVAVWVVIAHPLPRITIILTVSPIKCIAAAHNPSNASNASNVTASNRRV